MPLIRTNDDFWSNFFDHLTQNKSKLNAYDPENTHICHFHLRENNIDNLCLIGEIDLEHKVCAAKILYEERIFNSLDNNTEYRILIQEQFIQYVRWHKPPKYSVGVYNKFNVNFNDISERECLYEQREHRKMKDPKQLAREGLVLLEEAVYAILSEQPDLKPGQISNRLGITKDDYGINSRDYPIVASVLMKLKKEERVEPENGKWKLKVD